MRHFIGLLCDDSGASIVEYAVVAALIALPMLAIGAAIAATAATQLTTTTGGLQHMGTNPP